MEGLIGGTPPTPIPGEGVWPVAEAEGLENPGGAARVRGGRVGGLLKAPIPSPP